jgi:hypothetical protein
MLGAVHCRGIFGVHDVSGIGYTPVLGDCL